MKKRILTSLLSLSLLFSMFTTAFATDGGEGSADTRKDVSAAAEMSEGQPDAYWGHIPEDKTFAFADSRYYDGTDYVKVFNVGFYMGTPRQYYTNGDWTDLTKVYRREDYYKTEEFKNFSNTGNVGDSKPEGYPTNDVGGDAEGKLPSYNAGVYTYLAWTDFEMFGRSWFINYGIDSVINVPRVTTYVEIWRVEPNLRLTTDKTTVERGDEFTATLSIENHFDNYDGLPTAEQVFFSADHAVLVSDTVTKTDNHYTATFRATEDLSANEIEITAGVNDTATNYKPATTTTTLPLPAVTYTVTYTDGVENETVFGDQVHSGLSAGESTPPFDGKPSRDGYEFSGWSPEVADTVTGDATYTAVWTRKSGNHGGGSSTTYYYFAIEKIDAQDSHALNGAKFGLYLDGKQVATATSNRSGIALFRVSESDYRKINTKSELYYQELTAPEGYVVSSDKIDIEKSDLTTSQTTAEKNVETVRNYRSSTPELLNDDDHFAYVIGYKDGYVRPYGLISRAETTTIFFRLLKDSVRDGNLLTSNTYTDVPDDYWANTAISTMTGLGIVQGRSSTTFDPTAPITRAQFAAICARFDTGKSSGTQTFSDISRHWAEKYIQRAAELGWIKGFEDGTFRPDTYITRAQAMTMINRVLNRIPEETSDLLSSMNVWPDCTSNDWFYLAVQEATNSHDFKHKAGNYETWTGMNTDPNWTRYEN